MSKGSDHTEGAAFTMEADDRFHSIICSGGLRYDQHPEHETVMTFFVIRRVTGLHDIFHVIKTFKGDKCISRQVQTKLHIPSNSIEQEVASTRMQFSSAIQKATGLAITWDALDLRAITTMKEQVSRIHAWGRVGVRVAGDIPPISLN